MRAAAVPSMVLCLCWAGAGCGKSPPGGVPKPPEKGASESAELAPPPSSRPPTPDMNAYQEQMEVLQRKHGAVCASFLKRIPDPETPAADFNLVAVLDRKLTLGPGGPPCTRFVLHHGVHLDLDDLYFVSPERPTVALGMQMGDVFWVDDSGKVTAWGVTEDPNGNLMVEWLVEDCGPRIILSYGGDPCDEIVLGEE